MSRVNLGGATAEALQDVTKRLTGQTMDPFMALDFQDGLLRDAAAKENEKIFVQKGPINAQAAYLKFVRDNGMPITKDRNTHTIAKRAAIELFGHHILAIGRGNVWEGLAKHYTEQRNRAGGGMKPLKTLKTGYVRDPQTRRRKKISNLTAKDAQRLGVLKRNRVCKERGGIFTQVLCYMGMAPDGSCKRCRIDSLPKGMRKDTEKPFWSEKKPEARALTPRS